MSHHIVSYRGNVLEPSAAARPLKCPPFSAILSAPRFCAVFPLLVIKNEMDERYTGNHLFQHARTWPSPVPLGSEFLQPFTQATTASDVGVETIANPTFLLFEGQRAESILVFAGSRQSRCLKCCITGTLAWLIATNKMERTWRCLGCGCSPTGLPLSRFAFACQT